MRHSYSSCVRSLSTGRSRSRSSTKTKTSTTRQSPLNSFLSVLDEDSALSSLKLNGPSSSGDSASAVFKRISSIFYGGKSAKRPDSEEIVNGKESSREPKVSWLSNISDNIVLLQRKEHSRVKKQKCLFEFSQQTRFGKLTEICARVLGPEATIHLFGKVGRIPGVKGYNAMIEMCIEKARETSDEDIAIEEMGKVFHLFKSMAERGIPLEEQTYRPLLLYIIDMCLVEEFHFFCDVIKDENPRSISRLGYYEMMLYLRVNDEEKIQSLCYYIAKNDDGETSKLRESYLLALCESERKKEILELLEIIDIKKLSAESLTKIFQALGRLLLEHVAEKFLLDFKISDHQANNITNLIASYAVSIPDLSVEEVITKFKDLHQLLEVSPSSSSYEKLIIHSCALHMVHAALDIVDEMCEVGLALSIGVLHSILQTCEETSEYNLVHRIFSTTRHYNLETNDETFRRMIDLFLKAKDLEGAYQMLDDLEELNWKPTVGMYNSIMAKCFQEKNVHDGVRVLQHMQSAGVSPDSKTFSYLISNSETEEDIARYYEELKQSGIQVKKPIFIALINAYAALGQLEKAKQVVLDPLIPERWLNQMKSVLVSVLAAHGQLSDAVHIYDEIKQDGYNLGSKDVVTLTGKSRSDKTRSDGELDKLLLQLEELNDADYWNEACCRIILYCIRNKHISSAVDLCKLLKDKLQNDELVMEIIFDKVFSLIKESESEYLNASLELLSEIKKELGLFASKETP